MEMNPPKNRWQWPFSKPLEFLQKVKYGGAVGKKTVIAVVGLVVLAIAIVCVWAKVVPILIIVAFAVLIVLMSFFSIDKTLEKHPELALLDGTELLSYRKAEMEMAAKQLPKPLASELVLTASPTGSPQNLLPSDNSEDEDK